MIRALTSFAAFCAAVCATGSNPSLNLAIFWLSAAVACLAYTRRT